MNNTTVLGNIGGEVRLNVTQGGKKVASFSLAESVYGKNPASGNVERYTQWWDVAFWGTRAEKASEHLAKGSAIAVTGKVVLDQYTNRDGETIKKLKLDGNDWTFQAGGKKADGGNDGGAPANDDDIPF